MRRFAIFAAILLLAMAVFVACSGGDDGGDAVTSDLSADEPGWKVDTSEITMDWYIHFSWFGNEWGQGDVVSTYVTELTGVEVDYVVPAGNEAEKLNTLIAGDQLPDFVTLGWWEGQVKDMIDGELVRPLNVLADQYDPYWHTVTVPERVGWYTQDDGNIYGYPNASYTPSDFEKYELPANQTFLVRKDMYEAIGSPSMRTPEDFLAALRLARETFPEVGGQPLIPFGMHEFGDTGNYSLEAYIQNFLAVPYEVNGQLVDRFADPEYKRWMQTFRQAREEGLITTDIFVDKRSQMEEKIAQGRYFSMLYQRSDFAGQQAILYERDPESIYIAIDGPANSEMDDPRLAGDGLAGWTLTMISENAEAPDRAIRFMSYLMSEEGQKAMYLGVEGETWETVDGRDQFIPEVLDLMNSDRGAFDKQYGASQTWWMFMDLAMQKQWEPAPVSPFKEMMEWTYPYTVSYAAYDDIDPPVASDLGLVNTKIIELRGRTLPALVNAASEAEFEAIWQDWIDKKAELGIADLLAYRQEQVDDNKAKLGI